MNSSRLPLHTQNPLGRFSNRAEDYARSRPSYPSATIDFMLQGLPHPSQLVIADIGAGTGISAHLFADRGATVWAIEPNAAMRAAATPHPCIKFREGTAEQTRLPIQSVDLVVCCQAFHWFNHPAALSEFHRILKRDGRIALMWNDRNLQDPLTQAFSEVVGKAADRQIFDRDDRKSGEALANSPLFSNFRTATLTHTHRLSLDGLIGLVRSASYIPKTGKAYEQLISDLHQLYQQWVEPDIDCIELSYQVKLFGADRRSDD